MNKNQFISLIKKPTSIDEKGLKSIKSLTDSFPYCQIAHILDAKANSDANTMHANDTLKKAAVYSTNRTKLKHIINLKGSSAPKQSVETKAAAPTKVEEKKEEVKETKILEKAKPTKLVQDDIASEIQRTLAKSKEIKKNTVDVKVEVKEPKKEEKKTPPKKTKKTAEKSTEVKKETSKKKIEEYLENLPLPTFSVYSSRLGGLIVNDSDDFASTSFDYQPYNYYISAPEKLNKSTIIDEFIEKAPSIKRIKPDAKSNQPIENLADKSIKRKRVPKTETLAKLYLSQGNKAKALKIYEDLLLKVPEKRTYFAAQIEKLKNKK